MSKFVVFDVETPNRLSNRMSAIGITVIEKHNAVFDMGVLRKCLSDYGIE